jgi:polyhydroxybutyrate depolymerase
MRRLALLAVVAAAACRPAGTSQLQVGTAHRHYELFVPTDKPNMPLVIALHGRGGTGRQMERMSHFDEVAAREQFVVAYPDGIDHRWNDGRLETATTVDDVGFIASLIDELAARYQIDRSRVYVTGISNGAMMSFRLGCDLADRIAAIAPVAGNVPAAIACTPRQPVSLLLINGTDDPLVPYDGGNVGGRLHRGSVLSSSLSSDLFARADGCQPAAQTLDEPDADPHDGTRSRSTRFPCPAGVDVELVTIDGGGHTWPGGPQYLPAALIGKVSRDFDGADRIWEFFADHPHVR